MIPRALEQTGGPQLLAAERQFIGGERIGGADQLGHILALRVLLQIVEKHEGVDDTGAGGHGAMGFHQGRWSFAECVGQTLGHDEVVDGVR